MTGPGEAARIRYAVADDATALSALLAELEFSTSPGEVRQRLQAMHEVVLVAVRREQIVGLVTLNIMQVLHRPTPVGRVSTLVVAKLERGKGTGRALTAAAERILKERGCGLVEITSNFRREDAHAFYGHIGYEATSVRFKKEL